MTNLEVYFHKGDKQNSVHWKNYPKGCVRHQMESVGAPMSDLVTEGQAFKDACEAVGSIRSDKLARIAHILGGKFACPHASAEATTAATAVRQETTSKKPSSADTPGESAPPPKKQKLLPNQSRLTTFRKNDMPAFEDPEMLALFGMLRSTAPAIMPTRTVIGGRLLNQAAEDVELITTKALKGQYIGLLTDRWKCKKKDAVNAICANADFKSHLLELIEVTALDKDGESLCEVFAGMIDCVEEKHSCIVFNFTTDADGGSKKAHQVQLILGDYFKVNDMAAVVAEQATALIAWLNNHGEVRKLFDESQKVISRDRKAGKIIVLAYLVANLTRWTTHFVAFLHLVTLRPALELAVLQSRTAIIAAQVGKATSTEGALLKKDAEHFCDLIKDASFWEGLENVLGDLEPICLGTNINQKDLTRLDQVLLTIAGIYLQFADHPEEEVKTVMLVRLEKCWKACGQPAFLAALILNPFKKLTCFGPNANLNQFKCLNLLILLYCRMTNRPVNYDTPDEKKAREAEISRAFMQYLSGTGDFADFNAEDWEQTHENVDPIQVWEAFTPSCHLAELARFAINILHIVANQAGCERTFSRTKIEQSDHRARLGLDKIDKRTKIKAQIRSEHQNKAYVPRYRDLLEDQNDEDPSECGCALISSPESWRTQMAKWIGDTRAAACAEEDSDEDANDADVPHLPDSRPRTCKLSVRVMEEEERLMEELADAEEDLIPDDGAFEIHSDDEYHD
ncbi:ribonuclease H-like domain-containing protein [Mycena rebaudengoi]|nr:ribonuclease H-like domain-containing protein [Mycena rebaudengoi]